MVLPSLLSFHLPQHWYGACGSLAHLFSPHHPHFVPHHPAAVVSLRHPSHPHFTPPALVWCLQVSSVPLLSPLLSSPPLFPAVPSSHSGISMASLSALKDGVYIHLYTTTGPVSPSTACSAMRPPSYSLVHYRWCVMPPGRSPMMLHHPCQLCLPPLTMFHPPRLVLP